MKKISFNGIIYRVFLVIFFLLDIYVYILILFSPLFKKRKKNCDIGLYPYSQKGSDGYQRRFIEYLNFFEKDRITYRIFDVCTNDDFRKVVNSSPAKKYLFYLKNYLKRIGQTLQSRNCNNILIQRNLVPYFFDQKNPVLEKLAFKLCDNVIIDYWDAVWVGNPKLIEKTVHFSHKITVVNEYLREYFNNLHKNVEMFSLGINNEKYKIKKDYELRNNNTLTLVYTGLPEHTEIAMKILDEVWTNPDISFNVKLILISEHRYNSKKIEVEHHVFDENTFFDILTKADVGIYAVPDTVFSRGKLAMKTLDYAGAGLPQVCSPFGLSPFMENNVQCLMANSSEEWAKSLKMLFENKSLRERLGKAGRKMVEKHHGLDVSYLTLKEVINK